ncbi:MAG: PD-(D/E)XK nuclease family protein [Bacteroidia bacterium]|nr:PD-(D/E)XK nuclease family protein [Bacteroidia bacterium]
MDISQTNKLETLKKLISIYDSAHQKEISIPKIDNEIILTQLIKLYDKHLKINNEKFKKTLSLDSFRISTFALMEYNFNENTHSNILEYLFNYEMIGDVAIDILSSFIQNIGSNELIDNVSKKLEQKNYTIKREYSLKEDNVQGFIDLFILDKKNGFYIVIENKLLSNVRKLDGNYTQVDLYKKNIQREYKELQGLFILLSFKDLDEDYEGYYKSNYFGVYTALSSVKSNDNIFIEYKRLLFLILNGFTKDEKLNIRQKLKSNNQFTLHDMEKIKQYNYETI